MSSRNSLSSRDGGRPFSANRTQLPPTRRNGRPYYPEIKQRGYYSDILSGDAEHRLGNVLSGAETQQDTLWNIAKEKHTPMVTSFKGPKGPEQAKAELSKQVYGPTSEILTKSDFPEKSFLPKVQLPFFVAPGQCPRKIEIERRKRHYQSQMLEDLLAAEGVQTEALMPKQITEKKLSVQLNGVDGDEDPAPFPTFLPLDIFTDTEFDCRTPGEWLEMGVVNSHRLPVPGRALLPAWDSPEKLDPKDPSLEYEWFDVGMLDYDRETQLYLVQKTDLNNRILDEKGQVVINGGKNADGTRSLQANQYWVPRIQLMFLAEDPQVFAKAVASAHRARRHTEALLRYHLYVDCMPMEGLVELDPESLKRMVEWAKGAPALAKDKSLDDYIHTLEKEVNIDFSRAMNRITFDRIVQSKPDMFAFVTVPNPVVETVPERGFYADVPEYPFDEQYDNFAFNSLLTREEAIVAMTKVRTECNKVAAMSLFHVPMSKHMRLEEFEQTQGQASSQVQLFLKDSWIGTLRAAIRTSLRDVGKGWFNLHETNWEVYQRSKLKKFMEMVKFCMQDSLRYLVQDSLVNFTQMILDAACAVLTLPADLEWDKDLIKVKYRPKKNCLFLVDLIVDKEGCHYSTNLNNFETALVGLFDKGIASTQNVPQLEKFVLEDIFWADTPLLESVGEHEPRVEELRDTIRDAIRKALVPMKAYARAYEQFLELMNLDINEYIKEYDSKEHTAAEVKKEIESHLVQKEILENTIPSNYTIGPFYISTESVRQGLAKKRKALANALLELLAQKLRKQAEDACEEFKFIARKLYERPNCIEDLAEQKEWMATIPDKLKEHQELIDKAMTDYELIEEFYYNLSTDDFNLKWNAIGWPHKIEIQMETTFAQLEEDKERFEKIQLTDQNNFTDKLDTLQMVVAGFAAHTDINKAHEVANEVRRVNKQMKECQQLASMYNNRERLFEMPITNYDKLSKLVRDFEPFKNLWITTSDWLKWHESWMNDPLTTIDAEQCEKQVSESFKTMHKCVKIFKDIPGVQLVAQEIRRWVEEFRPYIPLIQGLRNPGMRSRHWEILSKELGFTVVPKASLTFSKCLEMKLQEHIEKIAKVAEIAGKEYSIEQALDKMEGEWKPVVFEIMPYKETGTFIMKGSDECTQLLDDHIVMTQSMSFSPYKKPFEERISTWEGKLRMTQDVLDEWLVCQRSWLYLEPIFSSDDINRQLPVEGKRYQTMDRMWRRIMKNAKDNPQVISLCPDARLLENLKECNKLLDQVQKGLSEYLETKRASFPRFYFLSDDELLEILSQTKDPTAVQPHLRKCFENIARLQFEDDLLITKMFSAEGEVVPLSEPLYPKGNVEDWLLEVERVMMDSIRRILGESLQKYPETPRPKWVLQWPGQVVIAGCQTFWTKMVEEAIQEDRLVQFLEVLKQQIADLVSLVRGDLSKIGRMILSALIVIEVHAQDVVAKMCEEKVANINDFEWISQLRYYFVNDNMYVRAVNAEFPYGYEYLGNSGRLVITPLTDRCYLTLTGALHLKFGGAPAGPAGTGKTETTKDLGKALAIQTVVFNCSDQLDFMAMGKFLKGLASSGAWACFDEFNRIDIEVLSVVAQQISTIQKAQQQKVDRFMFEGVEIALKISCAVFITMNPGYAGRTELPDNLKALFRPVAMMVPDYAMIAEISLYSFGFSDAKLLSKKITTTFKLSSEQLSSQDHYDFGMRAVKTVISAAGNLKRENPEMSEELIVLRAIRDVNVPKFLQDDLKLFNGIVSDLFPKIKEEPIDYGTLEQSIRTMSGKLGLKDVDGFVGKCIQLYETTVVRHGLMIVGPAGSGKTKCYEVLKRALTSLKGEVAVGGGTYENIITYVLNPKSITMGQLYGEFDLLTHEWTDGILSSLIRIGSSSMEMDNRWYVFDGPVDAVWIENMNTVLDDNKKLCLSSGEIIKLTEYMRMIFEVADLAVASPATVSRCGMVYLEPSILGLEPFVTCWLKRIPENIYPYKDQLQSLFDRFLVESIEFVRTNCKEIVATMDSNLTLSMLKLMDCFFTPFIPQEGDPPISEERLERVAELIEPWFIFSLVWTVGATVDFDGRRKFSTYLREKMQKENIALPFPPDNTVYDYKLDDGGISKRPSKDDEEEEEAGKRKEALLSTGSHTAASIEVFTEVHWLDWMHGMGERKINPEMRYSDIIVPTADTVRGAHLLEMLLTNKKRVLTVGDTGTGKTLTISDKLLKSMPKDYISNFISFSARTSANQTQDLLDSKLDKRRKGVFGPPLGKYIIFFIDDLNMPALEVYGAQPPIELIRQWMDHRGWYDRKQIGAFRELVDINFVCAMGPPGGGRNPVTARLMRHFNVLSFCELEHSSKHRIFATILDSWLAQTPSVSDHCAKIVDTTINVYETITTQLLPTPAKSHYTFNLRDLSKVFQGILMATPAKVENLSSLLRLWYHESCRVFQDRLVNKQDRDWFESLLRDKMTSVFGAKPEEVLPTDNILYGDFMVANVDNKQYAYIEDEAKMIQVMKDYLEDYNQVNTAQMKLVLFMDATKHVCRISRIIRQPLGNALLLGVGGSGRQSLTRLAAHMAEYDLFQIELSKNYGVNEWREDLKKVMMAAGLEGKPTVFLFCDTQIKAESFLEDINNILNSGDVPNVYGFDELDTIYNAMKPIVQDAGMQATKTNLFSAYTKRVKQNTHTVLCMSPIGEIFRARLRQFPSLVNCCTIDWFSEWPDEALCSVAESFLNDIPDLDEGEEIVNGLVQMCVVIHQSVAVKSALFLAELSRHNYVTPTSYLELLGIFSKLLTLKKMELKTAKNRTKTGLDKLLTTAEDVARMQAELETMQPQLEEASRETVVTMEKISKDTIVANETKEIVQKEEQQAVAKARETQEIADSAQRDLNEALPALDAALASLKSLNRNDVVEVRAMQRPPAGVRMTVEAVCIMRGVKPKKVAGDQPGKKVDDYWEPGKALLQDPGKFLESLFQYDKDNIPDVVINKIQPFIDNEEFQPAAIAKASKACTSICQWVRAMHKYHFVAKGVAPKRERLRIATEDLAVTQRQLDEAKAKLREVEEGIATLQAKYEDCIERKEELENKCSLCEARLGRADKLIGGLADEKGRWQESVNQLDSVIKSIVGDVLVSAGYVAYLGPFTGEYRASLCSEWVKTFPEWKVPHTAEPSFINCFGDPVKIRTWQIAGLPRDNLSIENGVIVQFSQRWPLFIDPQGQANKWIKTFEKDNGLDVVKLTDRDFLRSLENAVRFGKPCLLENVAEELDPALEPILLKQTFKQQGSTVIKLGDAVIPYHEDFKFYITTKLPNPHYTPEVSTKVTLVNFTLSPSGLEDQLLARVVAEERPDLEEAKNQLIVSNAKMKQELKEIEDKILERLSSSEGNPVDDVDLIKTLEASKIKSHEIQAKVIVAEKTEREIDETRSQYIPVAVRTQLLFFCTTDLANVDPMYQYSLEWFVRIFLAGIANSERADHLPQRILNINEYFTFSLYSNVCRSLFEKHKLMFAFLLCVRIMQNDGKINMDEWRFLLSGGTTIPKELPNPAPSWLSDRAWGEILSLAALPKFATFAESFSSYLDGFQHIFDSIDPHREDLPGEWQTDLDDFQKILVLKCIRADKVTNAMQDFVATHLGQRFIEPQTADLAVAFKESSPTSPLVFVLSQGTDPAADLYKFAEEMRFSKKLSSISLGQGQGPRAEAMMRSAMDRGKWVFFQNCHLSPSWMPSLERLIENIDPDKVHRDFRLWLTSMPSPKFPVAILQNSSKMTIEPPRGIKANLMQSYISLNDDFLNSCTGKTHEFKSLMLSLALFHGVVLERRKFGPLGFNIPYEFTTGDLRICISQLKMFLMEYDEIPFKVLTYTAGHINYGGRVTDDRDRRCLMNILNDFYNKVVLEEEHSYSVSGIYRQIPTAMDHNGYMSYIKSLPINDTPEIFGLHDNANITFAQNETFSTLSCILLLQPKTATGAGRSREEVIEETAKSILERVPQPVDIAMVTKKHPVMYEESMNTVLIQEVIRYNRLLVVIHRTLRELLKALKGLVVLSEELETMSNSMYINSVPELWAGKAYPSLKPLSSWVTDLVARMHFLQEWIDQGIPSVFWISGFFFPQAFLTGTLQNYARKAIVSIDTIGFDFAVMREPVEKITQRPDTGCYVRGLFLEGARWGYEEHQLTESRPKELYTDMPVMQFIPAENRKQPEEGIYVCPVYKTLTRAGALSTTGHSTNYVLPVEIPSDKPQFHWIKRGVALICALDY
ncbi:dynein heavy chain 1, axonemal-like isoform X1 [Acanthaster planci]|uniref:Dynein heavy chain 1, axonemal-like isoform X1 n=1 Tax=Acanthaster planci TaxID=133434 RepID=A0A8B7ZYD8_ACAPL|nr:dynein heavy chain 1, axonemal-like isoform X1 [Acanthaster planci]